MLRLVLGPGDPLDRLRLADHGAAGRTRFRYVGLTASVAQAVDDATGAVTRSVGNSWTGERLEDWTGTPSSLRVYGANGHGDTTWAAGPTGAVTGTARYDPCGTATSVTGSVPDFRFQGSWADGATGLSWAATRWYAPAQGRFISEDSLLGEPRDPDSRHLYAYGAGEPVGRWDPDGRAWYRVRPGDTLKSIALRYLGSAGKWPTIWNANRALVRSRYAALRPGRCLWIRRVGSVLPGPQCPGLADGITGDFPDDQTPVAARTLRVDWYNLTTEQLLALTDKEVGRARSPGLFGTLFYAAMLAPLDGAAGEIMAAGGGRVQSVYAGMTLVTGNTVVNPDPWSAVTIGHTVFIGADVLSNEDLLAHEYIHTLQQESGGLLDAGIYGIRAIVQSSYGRAARLAGNRTEAIAYLWQGWLGAYRPFGEVSPWNYYRPLFGPLPSR